MDSLSHTFHKRTVDLAVRQAREDDDFRISRAAAFLDGEQTALAYDTIAHSLGRAGYIGTLYVEQNDLGNGRQDIGAPRVNIEVREGYPTDAQRARRMASSTFAVLRRFPEDLR